MPPQMLLSIAAGCAGGGVHVLHADSLADALVFSLAADAAYAIPIEGEP